MKPCDCDVDLRHMARNKHPDVTRGVDGRWIHAKCGGYLRCEFSYLTGDHAADRTHCDYIVCAAHFDTAVDNVGSRET